MQITGYFIINNIYNVLLIIGYFIIKRASIFIQG